MAQNWLMKILMSRLIYIIRHYIYEIIRYDLCPFKKRGTRTWRRRPCDDGGGGWSDVAVSQACPGLLATTRNWKRQGRGLSRIPEGAQPGRHFDFGFLVSGSERQ